jgi:hypothetical protein
VLHDFLTENRALLIDRCLAMVAIPGGVARAEHGVHGTPIFLDQLIDTLSNEQRIGPLQDDLKSRHGHDAASSAIAKTASLLGRDLLEQGLTLEQVVHHYGNVCQVVTSLAYENGAPIEVDEFRTFNRCLDNAVAAAVTEYTIRKFPAASESAAAAPHLPLGPLLQELLNHLQTATLVVRAIKTGNVGISGATGAVLDRSLLGMRTLIDRSLAETRMAAGTPALPKAIHLATFLSHVAASALLDSRALGCRFTVAPVDNGITVHADAELLSSTLGNLLHNAFKSTQAHTEVRLHAHAVRDRVLIDIEDHCGGLPNGAAQDFLSPGARNGEDRSGSEITLDICRRSIAANHGVLRLHDVPGSGCILTIDLPSLPQRQ